jgi:NADH-quinone oxidoreductase subunit K
MGDIGIHHYATLAAILFSIGLAGVLTRKNVIAIYMSIELLLGACVLALVAFARHNNSLDGVLFAFFIIVVAAAEVAVGLALIVALFRKRESVSTDDLRSLKH